MRLRRCGTDGVLVELGSLDEVDAMRAALVAAAERGELPDLVELVPAARTVLITVRPKSSGLAVVGTVVAGARLDRQPTVTPREVRIPVRYDGPDRELVAKTAGIAVADLAELHSTAEYSVAFCGFTPGFGYLVGLPEPLRQPRLHRPRTKVSAGSVAIADEFTGVYPRSSPGGWRLIGHSDVKLFDPRRKSPALLAPGDLVRFEMAR